MIHDRDVKFRRLIHEHVHELKKRGNTLHSGAREVRGGAGGAAAAAGAARRAMIIWGRINQKHKSTALSTAEHGGLRRLGSCPGDVAAAFFQFSLCGHVAAPAVSCQESASFTFSIL